MTIKLSDIPQRDAFEILAAATRSCAVCHFRDQLAFTTMQLCCLLRIKTQELDEIVASYPSEVLAGEVFIAIGDELQDLLSALGRSWQTVASARLWTPRAALRIAALMTSPVAKAIHVQVAAYVASIEAQDWMADIPWRDESPPWSVERPENRLCPPALSSINELPPLQPELSTFADGNRSLQPELSTFYEKFQPFLVVETSQLRENVDHSARNTIYDKTGHSQ